MLNGMVCTVIVLLCLGAATVLAAWGEEWCALCVALGAIPAALQI